MESISRQDGHSERAPGFLGFWGRRTLIHVSGLLLMGCMSDSMTDVKLSNDFSVGIYLGVICLLHRGFWHEKNWYVSSLVGLIQTILLFLLGMPLYASIFWGGVQSWLQRVIRKWGQMGGEWVVLPLLIMACSDYLTETQALPFPLWPLCSVPLLTIAGYVVHISYQRIQREAIHKTLLADTLRRLQRCSESKRLAEDLQKQISIILAQAMTIEQAALHTNDEGRLLITNLDVASRDLEKQLRGAVPSIGKGGWSSELFKSKAWDKLTGKQDIQTLLTTFKKCNQEILAFLRADKSDKSKSTAIDSLCLFEQQARRILHISEQAPEQIAKEVEAIALLSFEIVKSMRDDPRDRPGGERFLQRYLPATEHIADEYTRLTSSNNDREDVKLAIRRAEEMLVRLHKAFSEELAAMLANDSASFTAELNALDKLLKMSGH